MFAATSSAMAEWPSKPLRLVVPFPAGGTTDVLGRLIAEKLSQKLGQPIVIENRSGAGGTIGATAVARAKADGYTYILGTVGSHNVTYALNPDMAYHPLKDFAPVVSLAAVPNVLVVRSDLPYKTLQDLLDDAKARPRMLTHGSTGIGASPQLSLKVMEMMAGVEINEIMYKGAAPAMVDLLGGHLTMTFDGVPTSRPQIESGAVRPLAVTSKKRVPVLPDVPSVSETLPGFEVVGWYGIWAPAGTPEAILERMNRDINEILDSDELDHRLYEIGALKMGGDRESFKKMHETEFNRWVEFVKTARLKPN